MLIAKNLSLGDNMREAYIVDGIRTPIGRFAGTLSSIRADDLATHVIKNLMKRQSSVDPEAIDDVILGCANQAGEDNRNVARMAALMAGLPVSVPGITVNRLCASGLEAVVHAARAIACNEGDLFLAGGVEHMTRAPYVMSKSPTPFGRGAELFDTAIGWRFPNPKMAAEYGTESMGETAENVAKERYIPRGEQDNYALDSQNKASKAQRSGRLALEIAPLTIQKPKANPIIFEDDEFIRPNSLLRNLMQLRSAFRKSGSVTAGNSSGINDGACVLMVASERAVRQFGLTPRARFVGSAVAGVQPKFMGIGPVEAVHKLMSRCKLAIHQMSVIELNEAFAAQVLACIREWNVPYDDERLNPNGGAIALGHPLGMTGARLVLTAIEELHQKDGRYGLTSMCVGVGQGMAAIFEKV